MNIPSMSLKDKVAIVTGSTKGIGKGIAFGLAQAGANVVVVSRHQNDCDRVAAEIAQLGVETLPVAADVTKMKDIENLVNSTLARFGRIDILVNNAGTALTKKAEEITEEDWDRVLDVDLKGVFLCA